MLIFKTVLLLYNLFFGTLKHFPRDPPLMMDAICCKNEDQTYQYVIMMCGTKNDN